MPTRYSDSYDPRTWLDEQQPTRAATDRRMLLGGAGVLGVLVLGGAAVRLFTPASPRPASGTATHGGDTATEPVILAGTRVETLQRRILTLVAVSEIAGALDSAGFPPDDTRAIAAAARVAIGPAPGEIRALLELARRGRDVRLVALSLSCPDGSGGIVTPNAERGYIGRPVVARLANQTEVRRGEIDTVGFYASMVAAGIPDTLIPDFAKALAFDFDLQGEVNIGDAFEAAFDHDVDAGGRAVGLPQLVYVAFRTPEKSRILYRFQRSGEHESGWYDGNGRSVIRSLMRTPVDGARISSGFGMRHHPILDVAKQHNGTDFAAPTGTSVFAAGDGVIEFAAMKGPNGNFVRLRHPNGWETLYLHLDHFAPDLAVGRQVRQGEVIGAIGTTGRSTGPHLHFEVHIDGVPVDPLTVHVEVGETLSGETRAAFLKARDRIDVSRAASWK